MGRTWRRRSDGVRTRWHRGSGDSATVGSRSTAQPTNSASTTPTTTAASHAIHGTVFDTAWTLDRLRRHHRPTALRPSARAVGRSAGPRGRSIRLTESAVALRAVGRGSTADRSRPPSAGTPGSASPTACRSARRRCTARDGIGLPTAELVDPAPGPWDDTFLNTDPGRAALRRTGDRVDGHRRPPTATTGWCTTSRRTPPASNRSPARRTR